MSLLRDFKDLTSLDIKMLVSCSYDLAMCVLQSDLYHRNMDAKDLVDGILDLTVNKNKEVGYGY